MKRLTLTRIAPALIVLALGGCKGSAPATAANAAASDPVFLLEAGEEPLALLRYQVAAGTTTASTLEFGLASLTETQSGAELEVLPGVKLFVTAGPSTRTQGGNSKWDEHVVDTEVLVPEGTPPRIARDLRASVGVLHDVGGTVERDDRGIAIATQLNEHATRADVPARLLVMLLNARTTLGDVPLPAEPVGLGARWETRKTRVLYGFKIRQVNTYTLIGRVGDELKLRVTMQQTALPQTLTFSEDGIEIVVDSFSANASGDIVNNLHALNTEAHATGESASRLTVRSSQGTEKVSTSRMFEFRTTNTDVQIPSP